MKIRLKLFAMLTDFLPPGSQRNEADIEVDSGVTVAAVIEQVKLPVRLVHLVMVNGLYIPPEQRATRELVEGDALAIWPPVAGG